MLREFVDGVNRTPQRAGELFAALDRAFPGDHRAAEALYLLALHAPRGRSLSDSEVETLRQCARTLGLLEARLPAVRKP